MTFLTRTYLILTLLCSFSTLISYIDAQPILNDDFHRIENHWFWRADGNQSKPEVKDGLLKLNLKNAVDSEYCNTEIYNPTEPYTVGTQVRIRLKASELHNGSRGWGFWDGDLDLSILADFDVAWVMQQGSKNSSADYNWFKFGVDGNKLENRTTINLDEIVNENIWHTYKMVWKQEEVSFSVDGNLIFSTSKNLPDEAMRLDIWIDNRVININNPSEFWNNVVISSAMYVDFVEVTGLDGPSIERSLPENILLWDSPNTYPDGSDNYNWQEYSFETSSGETLIFITGSAEYYGDIETEDELKIIIDNSDFGWKNSLAFDGDLLRGTGKSISHSLNLSPGEHKLKIATNQTPFLRDVIIANSASGKVIFNKQYNTVAPPSDGLWKEIKLEATENTNATILISGTADIGEKLTFELNDNKFSDDYSSAFLGNSLKNVPNTIILNIKLNQGTNYFRIFNIGEAELYSMAVYGSDLITDLNKNTNNEKHFKLNINPNPFNNSTIIRYTTLKSTNNKLTIYNTLGQQIEILINSYQLSGEHNIIWNSRDSASGIYFCVLESDKNFQVEKLVLLK